MYLSKRFKLLARLNHLSVPLHESALKRKPLIFCSKTWHLIIKYTSSRPSFTLVLKETGMQFAVLQSASLISRHNNCIYHQP